MAEYCLRQTEKGISVEEISIDSLKDCLSLCSAVLKKLLRKTLS
jgi:hypothetical protein